MLPHPRPSPRSPDIRHPYQRRAFTAGNLSGAHDDRAPTMSTSGDARTMPISTCRRRARSSFRSWTEQAYSLQAYMQDRRIIEFDRMWGIVESCGRTYMAPPIDPGELTVDPATIRVLYDIPGVDGQP
ncbi:hypothetical protein PVAG01_01436 [Phlyctema vagabunda]|uniref:Uncharacterized protein n=1 Tax=Phlyctema vagabunda TaxID=108571 RepID=A0ABR4PXR0_9HELO